MLDPSDPLFPDEPSSSPPQTAFPKEHEAEDWTVLIVDDEEDMHSVTTFVLGKFRFLGRGLRFLSAYSAEEARKLLAENPGIAVVLLDVVMDEHDSGLTLVRYIREELGNSFMRIILRTGQPGHAPEQKVIIEYDINDYREKTDLTSQKLITSIVTALRAFRDLHALEDSRRGLAKIVSATGDILALGSLETFVTGVIEQFVSLLGLRKDAMYCLAATEDASGLVVRAACGGYTEYLNKNVKDILDEPLGRCIHDTLAAKNSHLCQDRVHVWRFESRTGSQSVFCFEEERPLRDIDKQLLEIFFANVSIGFDNIQLNMQAEQKALIAEQALAVADKANKETIRQIAQRVESLRKITDAVAHNLRNPVTVIAGLTKLMLRKPELDAKYHDYLDGIVASAGRIEKIVVEVNEYNAIQLGALTEVFLPDLVENVLRTAKALPIDPQPDWIVEADPVRVVMDEKLVVMALGELLHNSREAMAGRPGEIAVRAKTGDGSLMLEVRDNGPGIPEEELGYALDPFYSSKTIGIGMGLAKVERVAQEHRGIFTIQSQAGLGTTAVIRIPLAGIDSAS
jgi:signal transduction histidine kinase/CheY-like chemotaxis protein